MSENTIRSRSHLLKAGTVLVAGLLVMASGQAIAGKSTASLSVRVKVVSPCGQSATVSQYGIACGDETVGGSSATQGVTLNAPPPALVHTDREQGVQTVVF